VNYIAPEIAKGENVDGRADLYSLGVILYELSTGQLPLTADSMVAVISKHLFEEPVPPNESNPELPLEVNNLILSLLRKDPDGRPSSARELRQILESRESRQVQKTARGYSIQESIIKTIPTHNLSLQPNTFIGREKELARIGELLGNPNIRLVTLVGIGGIGKTRLATQTAFEVLEGYPDGVWMVELASLNEADLLPQQIASVLGVSAQEAQEGHNETDVLVEYLRNKNLLLVIDNCEHLIEACAEFTEKLLKGCPNVKLLATSREDIRISGETVFHVSPMDLPPEDTPDEILEAYEAIHLFVERATAVRHRFKLTQENREAILQICQRLDGIPLAIELAAARIKVISPEQIASRLEDRFQLLSAGSRTALPRHQTLKATMDWSYNLLSEIERALFRQLAVFSGGWTLEAAEEITELGIEPKGKILDLLSQLVDKSLVLVEDQGDRVRYGMLETVRQYGKVKLIKTGEIEEIRNRHTIYFMNLAERTDIGLRDLRQVESIEQLENEHDNLRGALRKSIENCDADSAFRLVGALGWFWFMRGYWKESWSWLTQCLEINANSDPLLRAKAIIRAGGLQIIRGNLTGTTELVEEALEVCREHKDSEGIAWCLNLLGQVGTWGHIDAEEAASLLSESIRVFSKSENEWGLAWSNRYLGQICELQGNYEQSIELQTDGLNRFEEIGDIWNSAHSLYLMGGTMLQHGDFEEAESAYEASLAKCEIVEDKVMAAHAMRGLASLAIKRDSLEQAKFLSQNAFEALKMIGDEHCSAVSLKDLGEIARRQGEYEKSLNYLRESLVKFKKLGNDRPIAVNLERFAALASSMGQDSKSIYLLAAVESNLGEQIFSFQNLREEHERLVKKNKNSLGQKAFNQFWSTGTEMSLEEAVTFALEKISVE
jgi:non-specific serine/threonine protein kinase